MAINSQGFLEVFAFWGGIGYIWGEHSVADHYLHKNWIIFWGGISQILFFGGGEGDFPKTGLQGALIALPNLVCHQHTILDSNIQF